MRKRAAALLVTVLVGAVSVTGCGNSDRVTESSIAESYGREKQKIPNARQRMPMTSVPPAVKPRFLAFIKYQKLCAAYKMSAAAMPQQKTVPDMPGQNVSTRPSAM